MFALVRLRVLVLGRADERGRVHRVGGRRALLVDLGRDHGEVRGCRVAAPAPSTHPSMSSTLLRKIADVPTSAKSSEHALITALRDSSAVSFESMKSTTTFRPASPPWALVYFAQPFTPLTEPWKIPGAERRVDVGHHRDADRLGGDPDLGRRRLSRLLAAPRTQCSCPKSPGRSRQRVPPIERASRSPPLDP